MPEGRQFELTVSSLATAGVGMSHYAVMVRFYPHLYCLRKFVTDLVSRISLQDLTPSLGSLMTQLSSGDGDANHVRYTMRDIRYRCGQNPILKLSALVFARNRMTVESCFSVCLTLFELRAELNVTSWFLNNRMI